MNRYIVGQVVFFRARLSDPATGDPNDPTTQDPVDDPTVVLTVYAPDGTTQTPGLSRVSTGIYTTSLTVDQNGVWEYATNATGSAAGAAKERLFVSPLP